MPLPPALAARLKKRGIIQKYPSQAEEVEEVFAEDYDDATFVPSAETNQPELAETDIPPAGVEPEITASEDDGRELIHEIVACPNKVNCYHECGVYCAERWGLKAFELVPGLQYKQQRLLRKYPLPDGWREVGDPTTGRYYYWHTDTDNVSWLPPTHQRAKITFSADKLNDVIEGGTVVAGGEAAEGADDSEDDDEDSEDDADTDTKSRKRKLDEDGMADKPMETNASVDRDFEEIEKEMIREKSEKQDKRGNKKPKRQEALDPMDPASYSDVPRGGWTSGLEIRGAAKTGVDSTASGPLFQQRPYPSPGAVLKMNRAITEASEK